MSEEAVVESTENETKRPRRLIKSTSMEELMVSIEVVGVESGPVQYNLTDVSDEIKDQLALHGLSQKLGDSAAGKEGADAEASISETWSNLVEGKFRGERAAGERMPTKKFMTASLEKLSPAEQEDAKAALAKLGVIL